MKQISIDDKWTFRRGYLDSITMMETDPGVVVDLPHDGMIGTPVSKDAPAGVDSGFFCGGLSNYTKYVSVPEEWKGGCVGLKFDGVMMNATVDVNGSRVGICHNGYAPFYIDLTDYVTYGEENRITVNVNTSMQPNSRWYTGSGLYRGALLCHAPKVHIAPDGIYVYTKEVADGYAFAEGLVEVVNSGLGNRIAEVELSLFDEKTGEAVAGTKRVIQVGSVSSETARMTLTVKDPLLWDADNPNLYKAKAVVRDIGRYTTHFVPDDETAEDEAEVLFGIRTITADPIRGLLINGKSVKLKGGCVHHDNGLLGSVTLEAVEERKVRRLKSVGFNAIRTAHNPPSSALIEACDRVGMYVFDEAFDAWNIGKRGGDYHQFFEADWEKDLTAFVKRDRTHPSVIMWSTGNEIPERGGLGDGYKRAAKIAETIRSLDGSRLISNGICSLWSGLDDKLAVGQNQAQNAGDGLKSTLQEEVTEPFTNGLDVVGYNYMEDIYLRDHEMYPERVILGSENFPKEIGFRWPMVEELSYVIGDFTWTAWDYIGEAGIGKAAYVDPDDPNAPKNPWDLMPQQTSFYPWRLANDADFDITGHMLPQGDYRSVVWGSEDTHLYSMHPDTFGKKEIVGMWGFPYVLRNWNYKGFEGSPIELVVFSHAEEVEVFVNGKSIGRKPVSADRPMPCSARFETVYEPGEVSAVSYSSGKEISRDTLVTTGDASGIRLVPEKDDMKADGHDLIYVAVEIVDEEGRVVPDAEVSLRAGVSGAGYLAGFGSANPITEEDYTDDEAATFRGRAMLVVRSGYDAGACTVIVSADGMDPVSLELKAMSK
ncbi:beta-galactosidase [Lachnospiraceae bacterium XBB2008]|nr:beta-galactosidase [Lachnospiraceae bacterium XBB2008]